MCIQKAIAVTVFMQSSHSHTSAPEPERPSPRPAGIPAPAHSGVSVGAPVPTGATDSSTSRPGTFTMHDLEPSGNGEIYGSCTCGRGGRLQCALEEGAFKSAVLTGTQAPCQKVLSKNTPGNFSNDNKILSHLHLTRNNLVGVLPAKAKPSVEMHSCRRRSTLRPSPRSRASCTARVCMLCAMTLTRRASTSARTDYSRRLLRV